MEEQGRPRHGSPTFYRLLEEMAETHDKKSHDYASDNNPSGNYHFAGLLAAMFNHSPQDAGFVGRLGEKIYRLANLEGKNKKPKNEGVDDTERDIAVITALWMADRRDRRSSQNNQDNQNECGNLRLGLADLKSQDTACKIIELIPNLTGEDMRQMRDYLSAHLRDIDSTVARRSESPSRNSQR